VKELAGVVVEVVVVDELVDKQFPEDVPSTVLVVSRDDVAKRGLYERGVC
jgi:hypothetical protein